MVYDHHAKAEIHAEHYEAAADVYVTGLARLPKSTMLRNNAGYLAQEWARKVAESDPTKAVEALRGMRTRFPDLDDVAQAAKRHVMRSVQARAQKGEPEPALADLEAWKDLLPAPSDVEEAAVGVYDRWARGLAQAKSWQEAVDVYAKALQRIPANRHLTNNAVSTWHEWAKTFSDGKKWDEAMAIYDKGLERMPGTSLFKQNRAWCEEQKKKGG